RRRERVVRVSRRLRQLGPQRAHLHELLVPHPGLSTRRDAMGWLEGQAALVTGGASGLGRAVVDRFVQEGARVVVLDRSAEHIEKLRADHDRRTVVAVKGDVTSPAANEKAVAAAVKAFGGLDVFVGNAGIWDYSIPLAHLPLN